MYKKFRTLFKSSTPNQNAHRLTYGIMLGAAILALFAAFTLTINKFAVLQNPDSQLACSVNLVVDCSKVMSTWQSQIFGFPNMVIGLMAFSVIITVAVLGIAGTRFPRWFSIAANIGFLLGTLFSYWLFFQSVYAIQVLCPWCLLVTFTTTLMLATMTHVNLRENTFGLAKKLNKRVQAFLDKDFDKLIVASWIVLLIVLTFLKFGSDLFA